MKKSFVLYQSYKIQLSALSQSQKGDLLDAIFAHNENLEIELDALTKMAFSFIKAQLDRDKIQYETTVERRKLAGSKGGLAKVANATFATSIVAKGSKAKQRVANVADDVDVDVDVDKSPHTPTGGFDKFWQAYPIKKSKKKCEQIFNKLKPDKQIVDKMLEAIDLQTQEKKLKQEGGAFVAEWKNPSTWLNQECWNDEVSLQIVQKPKQHKTSAQHFMDFIDRETEKLRKEEELESGKPNRLEIIC